MSLGCTIACLENDYAFIFYVRFGGEHAFAILKLCCREFKWMFIYIDHDLNIKRMDKLNQSGVTAII